jgi:hypothetical protein
LAAISRLLVVVTDGFVFALHGEASTVAFFVREVGTGGTSGFVIFGLSVALLLFGGELGIFALVLPAVTDRISRGTPKPEVHGEALSPEEVQVLAIATRLNLMGTEAAFCFVLVGHTWLLWLVIMDRITG